MKLTIERAALLKALGHVQSVVEKRNTIPILANVLLAAEGSVLSLAATDMDLEIVESAPASVAQKGSTTVPAHTLYDIARKLPDGAEVGLELSADGATLSVKAGRSSFRLGCLPVADFPQMADGVLPHSFGLEAADLRTLIDRTAFAISADETRYYLNGIYVHGIESEGVKVLRAVATDGHRLARIEMPLPQGAATMPGVILPRKTVGELRKLITDAADPISVSLSETRVRFAFDNIVLVSKLIDGTFPDYERVIPSSSTRTLEVEPHLFAAAVDRVATIATDKTRAVKMAVADKTMTVSASSTDGASATDEIEVSYEGGPIEIGFNARYLLDIASQIEGDNCRVLMNDAASPAIIRDTADMSALYVLMPMRV